jgi:hypothetical protein
LVGDVIGAERTERAMLLIDDLEEMEDICKLTAVLEGARWYVM